MKLVYSSNPSTRPTNAETHLTRLMPLHKTENISFRFVLRLHASAIFKIAVWKNCCNRVCLTLGRGLDNIRFAQAAPFGSVQPMDHDEGQGVMIIDILPFGGRGKQLFMRTMSSLFPILFSSISPLLCCRIII